MAPLKKSKSVNKGINGVNDSSPSKDDKSKPKKRKLSDMLGPQWSKVELQRFYEGYRKYGKSWKKVASVVRSRSSETVEALYNMNRAYLSLPEGTASVSGLIAMMIDHYNVMDGSDSGSEKDSEDTMLNARKVHKHIKAKGRLDSKSVRSLHHHSICSSDKLTRGNSLQPPSIRSSDGCLSLLKKIDGVRPNFPVRKRTPRVDVSSLDSHLNKRPRGSVMNGNNNGLSNGGLFLSEARQNLNPVDGAQAAYKSFEYLRNSQPLVGNKPKSGGFASDEESMDESLSRYGARIEKLYRTSMDPGTALADYKKGEKVKKKEAEIPETQMFKNMRDDYKFGDKRPRIGFVSESARTDRSPSESQRRKNKHITEDEHVACDALQTLADLSLVIPDLSTESVEDAGKSWPLRGSDGDTVAQSDVGLHESPIPFKKRRPQASKIKNVEQHSENSRKQAEKETLADKDIKSGHNNEQLSIVAEPHKSLVKSPDVSLSNGEHLVETELAVSSSKVQASCHDNAPTRRKSRRKRDRKILQKDRNHASDVLSSKCSSLFQDRVQCVKDKICHCLSCLDVRKWCSYEWFYSAIDYPWFAKRDFVEYLNHVGLGHIPRLTRVEWGVIRSSLGKPRRFSERFLQEERDKLKQYRECVRTHYANLRAGLGDGLPTDLARPLLVGQKVVSIHPRTRELHDGSVLAVDRQSYLIQFDCRELGDEVVMDIDCMPLNPVENMPESLRQQKVQSGQRYSQLPKVNGTLRLVSNERMQNLGPLSLVPPSSPAMAKDMKVKQVFMNSHDMVAGNRSLRSLEMTQIPDATQMQAIKVYKRPIPCLTRDLDKKVLSPLCGSPNKAPCRSQPVANSGGVNGTLHSLNSYMLSHEETASNVVEIVQGSRDRAQKMVDVVVKAVSSVIDGDDAYGRIGEAFNASFEAERESHRQTPSMMMSSYTVDRGSPPQNPVSAGSSEPQLVGDISSAKPVASDVQVPSELITSCVATLLVIQTCTERQYPPGEVAQMLDNALSNLQPSCSQNLSVYREIQMCMGRIKTQILALVPS